MLHFLHNLFKNQYLLLLFLLLSTFLYSTAQTITTFAGDGTGDGGAATSARLNFPAGVAVDAEGNIYIADHFRIRKITPGGIITTVAGNGTSGYGGEGGPATKANINGVHSVAVDVAGNIYIAERWDSRIRKISASDGIILTVAGRAGYQGFSGDGGPATSASLNGPTSVAVDAEGNLYIADQSNNRIRKVNASDGIINTIAGNGSYQASGDGAAAINAGIVHPTGLALDTEGNIYTAEQGSARVRKIKASDSTISTIAGTNWSGYSGDGGPATSASLNNPNCVTVDATGNVYIADMHNNCIRKINAGDGTISTIAGGSIWGGFGGDGDAATNALLKFPTGVVVDKSGHILIVDSGNNRIRKIASSGTINTIAGNSEVSFCGDGGPSVSACLSNPVGVAVDIAGNVYIADKENNRIRKASTNGLIITVAGNGTRGFGGDGEDATSASLHFPTSVAVDGAGNLYIADQTNHRIRKVSASDGRISTIAGNGTGAFSGDGGPATSASLHFPAGVAVDADENIYIVDLANQRIRKVNASDGRISTIAGNGTIGFSGDGGAAIDASFNFPADVAVDTKGNVYIADNYNKRVRKINSSNGVIHTIAGNGYWGDNGEGGEATNASLTSPVSISLDSMDNLYIANRDGNRIHKVNASDGTIHTVAGAGYGGYIYDGGAATRASLNNPSGVAVDREGNIYIADSNNNRIRLVSQTIITLQSGNWEDPNVWNIGRAPISADKVILDQNHTVTINEPAAAQSVEYRPNAKLLLQGSSGSLQVGQQ